MSLLNNDVTLDPNALRALLPLRDPRVFARYHPEFSRERPEPLFAPSFDVSKLSYFPTSWLKRR